MNFNMGTSGSSSTSGRQGFYNETDHGNPSNSSNHHHHHHHLHRSWLDGHMGDGGGGGGGGSGSQLELMMDSSPTHRSTTSTAAADHQDQSEAIMRESGQAVVVEREHMFDKVVTPSDVGKLNRLVIPKQHAERYFPLDSSTNEKGLLLNFEDRNGKPWRFRYSYWNSSQSYVMTKGWSRFVKEKKLDAGDIVSFQRGVGESAKDRLFIDWRRRPDAPPQEFLNHPSSVLANLSFPHHFSFQRSSNINSNMNMNMNTQHHQHPWNPMYLQTQAGIPLPVPLAGSHLQRGGAGGLAYSHLLPQSTSTNSYGAYGGGGPVGPYGTYNVGGAGGTTSGSVIYFRSAAAGAGAPQPQLGMVQMQRAGSGGGGIGMGIDHPPADPQVVFESVPVVHGKAAAKRLRLFGVNMDCPISEEDEGECEIFPSISSTATTTAADQAFGGYGYIYNSSNSSSSSSTIPYLQLRPFSGTPIQTVIQQPPHPPSSSSTSSDKGKASMSLDLDI